MPMRFGQHGTLKRGDTALMGVLNVTPDSFSDAGQFLDASAAVAHGLEMARQGARFIDVGGESTRPGAQRVPADQQLQRVLPVLRDLRRQLDAAGLSHTALSIDTTLAPVAAAALDAGAAMINDVSAARDDPAILQLAASRDAPIVLMHMLGSPATMQQNPHYQDVAADVLAFLENRAAAAIAAGIDPKQIVIDPGIGFGKSLDHNLQLLASLQDFVATGYAVMLGSSRKQFIAMLLHADPPPPPPPQQRLGGTCAATVLAVEAGVTILRVHDVAANHQALELAKAVCRLRALREVRTA